MSYESFDAYLSVVKSTPSEIFKDEFQEFVNAEYGNSTTLKSVLHNGNSIEVRVVGKFNNETLSRQNDDYQKIIFKTPDYVVNIGDIFEFDNLQWICTDITYTTVSKSCTVSKSNNTLKFYKNGILYKIPYVVIDNISLTRMGEEENKYITIPESAMMIMVADTEITRQIKRNDVFVLYDKNGVKDNYEIVDINRIRKPGLIIFETKWTAVKQKLPDYKINILNGNNIQVSINDSLAIQCEVLNGDEIISPTPPLVYSSSNEAVATIDESGIVTLLDIGTVTFTISLLHDPDVKNTIVVEVADVQQDNYVLTISGNSSIVKGKSSIYTAMFTNNGVPISMLSEFWLTDDSGNPTTLASITAQDPITNTCVVAAGNTLGHVRLWCKDIDDKVEPKFLRIQIRNVF